jgi:hypothetical protein
MAKQPLGPPMPLGNNMRELVVRGLRENESDNEAERGRLERALEIGLEDTSPRPIPSLSLSPDELSPPVRRRVQTALRLRRAFDE